MDVTFTLKAWKAAMEIIKQKGKSAEHLVDIIEAARRGDPSIGKPEKLKGNFSGKISRRINRKDRLVYYIDRNSIVIERCQGHYLDK